MDELPVPNGVWCKDVDFPDTCCDKDKVKEALNQATWVKEQFEKRKSYDYIKKNIPPGDVGGGYSPAPYVYPKGSDPCVMYCVCVHEWKHQSMGNWIDQLIDEKIIVGGGHYSEIRPDIEIPAYEHEIRCLQGISKWVNMSINGRFFTR